MEHFLHRCEVIGSYYGLDAEMTIIAFIRLAVAEHYATGHRIGALYIRIVEALDMPWLHRKAEVAFHLFHQIFNPSFGIELLALFLAVGHILACIFQTHLKYLFLVATLRDYKIHVFKLIILLIWQKRNYDITEPTVEPAGDFGQGHRQKLGGRFLHCAAEFEIETLHHCPTVEMHETDVGRRRIIDVGQHIHIPVFGARYH